jgi:uncharacterized membrane protein (UPF0127 family)
MKRLVLVGMVLIAGGLFFYILNTPASLPIVPESAASTSTATTYAKPESTPSEPASEPKPAQKPPAAATASVKIGSVNIPAEVARTSAEVQKGLSGRLSLDQDKGMLFMFAKADIYSFWMPDMHFPLDIIWISSAKKVVGISADVSNEFDPANPKFYRPPSPAQYVLEVNAGFAAKNGIKIGNSVTFANI